MKSKIFLLIFCLLLASGNNFIFSQKKNNPTMVNNGLSYTALWTDVDKFEQQSLPKSALEKVEQIYQKALNEKNSPELLKSLIFRLKYNLVLDKDKFPQIIGEMEQYTTNNPDVVEKSVLYSMLANLYGQYYRTNSYLIDRRTALVDFVPEDIREWSGNIFYQKVKDYVDLSIRAKKELQVTDALQYATILTQGKASRNLRPTLYDFLVCQGIHIFTIGSDFYAMSPFFKQTVLSDKNYFSPADKFVKLSVQSDPYDFTLQAIKLYQELLAFRLQSNNQEALLMADLDRLKFVYQKTQTGDKGTYYIDALSLLEKQFEKNDICVEILFSQVDYYNLTAYEKPVPLNKRRPEITQPNTENLKKIYEICQKGIQKYPKYDRIGLLKNQLNELTSTTINVQSDRTTYPDKDLQLKINSYKNVNSLTVEVYKINAPVSSYENSWELSGLYKTKGTLVDKKTFQLNNPAPYIQSDTVLNIPVKDLGCYEYVVYTDQKTSEKANQQFSVSRLASINRSYDGMREFLVTDRITGKPIEGAKINFYRNTNSKNTLVSSIITDKNGLATAKDDKNISFYNATFNNDDALILSSVPWVSTYQESTGSRAKISLFTDRSIYRPGQTVNFKGIAVQTKENKTEIMVNRMTMVRLRDANYKEVSQKTFYTNEFGSFNGEFVLPQNGLSGNFTLETDLGSVSFKVEEYKRPTFDIKFLPVDKTYNFGDKVTAKGEAKTFSGVNLQDVTVKYRIVQRSHWFWRWIYRADNQIAEGSVQTDENGQFQITFPAEKQSDDKNLKKEVYYTYEIRATVTNTNGESQESTAYISVGDKSMILQLDGLEEKISKENLPQPTVNAINLNDNTINCKGTFEIYNLQGEQSLEKTMNPEDWKKDKLITSGNFISGEKINLDALKKVNPGKYRIYLKTKDDQGHEVTAENDFILYSNNDKQPPVTVYEWLLTPKTTCAVGEKAEIVYGSSAKDVSVLYEIFKDDKKLSASRFELNNNCRKLEIPFLESYGDKITASLTFIKDGNVFTQNIDIRRKQPDKKLDITLDIFRDKLLPGQKEEWKISIKDADKKPVLAEVLSGMYDASLDKIYTHSWNFSPVYHSSSRYPSFTNGNDFQQSYGNILVQGKYSEIPVFTFDSFNWFGLDFYSQTVRMRGASSLGGKVPPIAVEAAEDKVYAPATKNKALVNEGYMKSEAVTDYAQASAPAAGETQEPIQIRQNFNETAFFYPQLRTNAAGETVIAFTVPESNTTWKFMALAHTQDLKYGQIIKEAVSRKKLMVAPNLPRFIRQGDKTTIVTNISNLSDETINGTVSIEFFDPGAEKAQIIVANNQQNFSVEAGKTTSASWTFDVPSGIDLTACRIVAKSANFSDGEQHLLPVLTNRMLVTESKPLNISGIQTKQFSLDKLVNNSSQSLENYRLTLEFASNPAWYAVQALPSITHPVNENVIEWFGSYYSNTLAGYIANSTPKIKQIIDVWTKQGGTKETLLSNLEKNQELKAILLEETPWVLEAENESEQKQKLSLLFDINRLSNYSSTALQKLKELQTPDGGWSWFKGMNASPSMTQWILYCFSGLKEMNALQADNEIKEMQKKAITYIDNVFQKNFEQMKKYNKDWAKLDNISTYDLEYLLVRSSYLNEIPLDKSKEAFQFYLNIADKYWTKNTSLYARAINAIVQNKNGQKATAESIIRSLKEHASNNVEMGMYWANNNTSAFAFQSATFTHTFIMQAFKEIGTVSDKDMDAMKLWLLKQKQTQQWENVPATVNSIATLLQAGSNWLENQGIIDIQLGKEKVNVTGKEAGTGYFKKVYPASEIKPEMGKISVSKQDAGPAWGSLYWQYFEDLDKITQAKTDLNVEKKLFVEKISTSGKTLEAVTPDNPLKVGDKVIVRLTIRNNRDMEYVMLKDMRAACFEPAEQLSGSKWRERVIYYQTTKDASTNFFFEGLPKGTYVFEYPVYVNRQGDYSGGITTIQCMYAPEFVSHTAGGRIVVK